MTRDEVLQCLLTGLGGGVSGCGFAALLLSGFKSDDVFAFGGALVGAAAAVGGGAWLADRTAKATLRRETGILTDECIRLLAAVEQSIALLPEDQSKPWPTGFKPSLHHLNDIAIEVPAIFREAIAKSIALDFRQRVKVIKAEGAVLAFATFHQDAFSDYELPPQDERDWPSTLQHLRESLTEMQQSL
ncbi:hypothetical protein ASE65_15550 [Sphingomonas sp. Leaf16]|nr:hypothetical protein ASE65_15550 [Sphingomonas sp. Leaf16]KQN16815.1 hypothetical protein ASE81_15600 [Sphingomonas sp. Leaf29]KQN22798.1 hypothetical protein ASE83_15530 [Sphingomonas sp. Leaf32]